MLFLHIDEISINLFKIFVLIPSMRLFLNTTQISYTVRIFVISLDNADKKLQNMFKVFKIWV